MRRYEKKIRAVQCRQTLIIHSCPSLPEEEREVDPPSLGNFYQCMLHIAPPQFQTNCDIFCGLLVLGHVNVQVDFPLAFKAPHNRATTRARARTRQSQRTFGTPGFSALFGSDHCSRSFAAVSTSPAFAHQQCHRSHL